MKKLLFILCTIIVIIVGVGYFAFANSALIVAQIVSHKTKTPVTISRIDFHRESFVVTGIQMGNPKGARLPTALKVKTIDVQAPYRRYFEDPINIDQIHVADVYVNIQLYNKEQTRGNWQTIMETMVEEHKSPLSNERVTIIKKLILTNITIDLILADGSVHHLSPIKRLEFDDVRSDKGIPIQEISEIIITKMVHSIFLEKGLKAIIEAPIKIIEGIFPFL
ncbi:MAG: hypothetical protein K1060chlam2_01094 [Chlamydiae bacterium]|nr:hypothetical protein [Chlamydiota bacterium]